MVAQSTGQGSLIGATIGGYKVEALIGRGAMGAVYLARDMKLNRLVALKVLLGSLAKTPSQVKEFLQEAQTAAPIHHPGIVRIYTAGVEDGTPFIAMEFVDGEPLDRFLKRKGAIKWGVALHITRKLAGALHSAHKVGVVHRDIKPSNIMLDQKGGVRLTDFGIARVHSENTKQTRGQGFLGTPQYMSPEQALGEEVTTSSDLYSLGVTMYEMIGGQLPFTGESPMALINSICNDSATRLNVLNPEVPDDVARFVAYLMGKTPKERPANAKVAYAMAERLQKQKGELSSVSDSLTGFIQDAMEVRPFQSAHQSSAKPVPKENINEARQRRERNRQRFERVARIAIVLFLGIIAFGLGAKIPTTQAIDLTRSIPEHESFNIRALDDGVRAVQLPSSSHELSNVHWIGSGPTVWMTTRGKSGSDVQDAIGALGFDVEQGRGFTLAVPQGSTITADADPVYMNGIEQARVVSVDDDHPFAHRFLVSGADRRTGEVVFVSRRWDRATPDPAVLLRVDRSEWIWDSQSDPLRKSYGQALVHPDGTAIAYLLYNSESGYSYIVEQTLNELGEWEMGADRTSAGVNIQPQSLQYSPDGSMLMYLRGNMASGAELWKMDSKGSEVNGDRIRGGIQGNRYAISSDGATVAVMVRPEDDNQKRSDVALVQTQNGREVGRLGPGRLSKDAFHPNSQYIVINRRPEDAEPSDPEQLVAVDLRDLSRSLTLTQVSKGMSDAYAFSADGRYLASLAHNPSTPSMLLLEWKEVIASRL